MPLYDCGDPDCEECRATFPDRVRAIALFHEREEAAERIKRENHEREDAR